MKKNYLFLLLLLGLLSCSQDDIINDPQVDNSQISERTAGDGKYDVLGYGYDITDEYMGEKSVKKQVVDIKRFIEDDYDYKFDNPFVGIIDDAFYAGENAWGMTKEIMKKNNFNGSIAPYSDLKKENEDAYFSGSITKDNNSKYSFSTKYSFARGEVIKKQRQLIIDASPELLSNYLHRQFKEDLLKLSADQIVVKYGTHVMTDIIIGGLYKASYKSTVAEENSSVTKSKAVEAGLRFNLGLVGISLKGSMNSTEINTFNKKNSSWSCNITTIGGTTNGHIINISPGNLPTTTINISEWANSVNDNNSKLIELNWDATYPIYEFITDPVKKQQIKVAAEKYIESKRLDMIELVPFYRYYHPKGQDHLYMSWYTPEHVGWKYESVLCYVPKNANNNTKPLYGYWNVRIADHLYTCWAGQPPATIGTHWKYEGVQAYVFNSGVENTIPIYQFWNSKAGDHLLTHERYPEELKYGWKYEGIQFYAYPPH